MKLRSKMILLLGVTIIIVTLIIYVASSVVLLGSFNGLEEREGIQETDRALNLFCTYELRMSVEAWDYAYWDLTYDFIENGTQEYLDTYMTTPTFHNLNVDLIVISDINEDTIWNGYCHPSNHTIIPIPEELRDVEHIGPSSIQHWDTENGTYGSMLLGNQIAIVACRPVRSTNELLPINGYFTMASVVSSEFVQNLNAVYQSDMDILPYDPIVIEGMIGEKGVETILSDNAFFTTPSQNRSVTYTLIRDIYDEPAALLTLNMDRAIFEKGQLSITYVLISLGIACIILILATTMIMGRFVISRIERLDDDVETIKVKGGRIRTDSEGRDEIDRLTNSINDMLDSLNSVQSNLQKSEDRLRGIVEDQTEMIVRISKDYAITFANQSFCEYFDIPMGKAIGMDFNALLRSKDIRGLDYITDELSPITDVVCLETASDRGEKKWQRWTVRAIFDTNGNIVESQLVGNDVTQSLLSEKELRRYRESLEEMVHKRTEELARTNEQLRREVLVRKETEKRLFDSQERYREVVEDQTELIYRFDRTGNIVFANRIFFKFFPKEMMAEERSSLLIENKKIIEMLDAGGSRDVINLERSVQLGESTHWLSWTFRANRSIDGNLVEVQGVGRDDTEKRRLEDEIIRSQKMESLGFLAGGIAHDFNNMLSGLLGNISILKMRTTDKEIMSRMEELERVVHRSKSLTDRLLTFAQGGEPIRKRVNVAELLDRTMDVQLVGSAINLVKEYKKGLWDIHADGMQIEHAITNLVDNSKDALGAKGTLRIEASNVQLRENDTDMPFVMISIIDDGIGMDPEVLDNIFDPYFTTKMKGGGFGLPIVHSIVTRHGGRIEVESTKGIGTAFHLFFPALIDRVEDVITEPIGDNKEKDAKILIMDDEESILDVTSELLKEFGFRVVTARNGEEAIEAYAKARDEGDPVLVCILDLTIRGGMGGSEAMERLIAFDPNVKAIVSSGYSNDPVMSRYSEFGFSDIAPKPYMISDLVQKINRLIAQRTKRTD